MTADEKLTHDTATRIADVAARNAWDEFSEEDAMNVLRCARNVLEATLNGQRTHEHMLDDCGDYLYAATENWDRLFVRGYWENDGTGFEGHVKDFLLEHPSEWLACDGEIRYDLWSDEYVEAMLGS